MAQAEDWVPLPQAFGDRAAENIISIDAGIGKLIVALLPPLAVLAPTLVSLLNSLLVPLAHLVGGLLGSFSPIPISEKLVSRIPTDILKDMYVAGVAGFTSPISVLNKISPVLGIVLGIPLGIIIFVVLVVPLVFLFGGLSDLGRWAL